MKKLKNVFAMIPARLGSQRLKKKNLKLVGGKALIEHAILSAKKANIFDKIIVNSEANVFKKFSDKYDVDFYKRNKKYASNFASSDLVVKDFFDNFSNANILVWVNTTTPFLSSKEIVKIVNWFIKKKNQADTLITTEKKYAHANFNKKPLNYKKNSKFARTQDLQPIEFCNYALMIWRKKSFLKSYKRYKSGILSGKVVFYPIYGLSTLMVKKIEDLELADFIMKNKNLKKSKIFRKI